MLDFLGIGAQKAGTTWLYTHLSQHEKIDFPAGKEVHFWDLHYDRGVEWYCSLFVENGDKKHGEITPAYGHISVERISEIHHLNPSLRIIYMIRNPMERAWSSALMALERSEMAFEEASDQWFIDHFRSAGSLARGDYESCIKRWCSVFDREQILIERYESISESPRKVLKCCCAHIGVDGQMLDYLTDDVLSARVFQGPKHKIRPSLREFLAELYLPIIASLQEYLLEDFSSWTL
jgi:hypothetical protein